MADLQFLAIKTEILMGYHGNMAKNRISGSQTMVNFWYVTKDI